MSAEKRRRSAFSVLGRRTDQSSFVAVTSICMRLVLLMSSTVVRRAGLPIVRRSQAGIPSGVGNLFWADKAADFNIAVELQPAVHLFLHGTVNPQSDISIRIRLVAPLFHRSYRHLRRNPYVRRLIIGPANHHVIALVGAFAILQLIHHEGQLE